NRHHYPSLETHTSKLKPQNLTWKPLAQTLLPLPSSLLLAIAPLLLHGIEWGDRAIPPRMEYRSTLDPNYTQSSSPSNELRTQNFRDSRIIWRRCFTMLGV
ncbi:MAG: hypothetical protein VKJ64_07405, partial [Leptolyngbyaceae bacterium]|nr:hypothetical protein [Leptolyngbyaceae bacterium]